jgi:hypothetical protein
MSSEQRTARETLEQAFRAGFAACQDNTDKYGEYNGDSIEEEFAAFAASLRAAPAPTGDYSAIEQDCRGCMGPCGRCHESGAAPAPEPEHATNGIGRCHRPSNCAAIAGARHGRSCVVRPPRRRGRRPRRAASFAGRSIQPRASRPGRWLGCGAGTSWCAGCASMPHGMRSASGTRQPHRGRRPMDA